MAKKFIKFIIFISATIGVIGGGLALYNKFKSSHVNDEDFDDFDDEDFDDDFSDLDIENRGYTTIPSPTEEVETTEETEIKETTI